MRVLAVRCLRVLDFAFEGFLVCAYLRFDVSGPWILFLKVSCMRVLAVPCLRALEFALGGFLVCVYLWLDVSGCF